MPLVYLLRLPFVCAQCSPTHAASGVQISREYKHDDVDREERTSNTKFYTDSSPIVHDYDSKIRSAYLHNVHAFVSGNIVLYAYV